ncbi:hypothetical protein ADL00_23870 [Streptomyces sp. AS58]|nr:hypothetical protein ADL00_23870 [Streptomyces sp. AS58]
MTQARDLEGGAGVPYGELSLDTLGMGDEGAARMGDVRGTELAQQHHGLVGSGRRSRHGAVSFRRLRSAPVRAFACGPDPAKAPDGLPPGPCTDHRGLR